MTPNANQMETFISGARTHGQSNMAFEVARCADTFSKPSRFLYKFPLALHLDDSRDQKRFHFSSSTTADSL